MTLTPPRKHVLMTADPNGTLLNPYLRIVFGDPAFRAAATVRALPPLGFAAAPNLHVQWPEYLLHHPLARRSRAAAETLYWGLVRTLDRVRRRGGRIVWTAHNLHPHEFPTRHAEAAFARWSPEITARIDTLVAMSPATAAEIARAHPGLAASVAAIPHPHYRGWYSPADPAAIRRRHAIPATAHLTVAAGLIRPYKRIPALIAAFAAAARADEYLLVAGPCPDPAQRATIESVARTCPRVRLSLAAQDDTTFATTVAAADLFAANFDAILNSGSVIAALSLDRPVLAPRLGALADLAAQVGPGWLALFDGPLTADTLRSHLDTVRQQPPAGRPDLGPNDPAAVARAHLALYR